MGTDAGRSDIDPSPEHLDRYLEEDDGRPVAMLNLLRFKPGGRERFAEYLAGVTPVIESIGGEIVYAGEMSSPFIPAEGSGWDAVVLSRWPRRQMLLELVERPEYPDLKRLRSEAVDATVLETTVPFP